MDLEAADAGGTEYEVIPRGGHSDGREHLARYVVAPRLPDDLVDVTLQLVAGDRTSRGPPRVPCAFCGPPTAHRAAPWHQHLTPLVTRDDA